MVLILASMDRVGPYTVANIVVLERKWRKAKDNDDHIAYVDQSNRVNKLISSAECKKVVSDIFGKIEFLMEYENIGLYAHFALFSRFLALLFSKILSKMCSNSATYDPIALILDKCV